MPEKESESEIIFLRIERINENGRFNGYFSGRAPELRNPI
jgi:hypothetical protein